ncbi:MAG TPA: transglutaminase family protein, partial [Candidatus Didemnitutus sp.]|nr:transglutaminase family protein [Candidatus Didemnitutus sp.]
APAGMKLRISHRTRFAYGAPVRESFNEARLQPLNGPRQACSGFELKIHPPAQVQSFPDFYRNTVHQFEVTQPHTELLVETSSVVTTSEAPELPVDAATGKLGLMTPQAEAERCYDYLQPSTYVDVNADLTRLARDVTSGEAGAWHAAQLLLEYVHREFNYQPATTNSHTHMREVLQTRAGVCQDFSHVMLGLCRSLQLPARYVSGYLFNGPTEQLKGAQASHAWVEVFLANLGWLGLDPTNNQIVAGRHVKVAVGRDYADVPPIKGTYRGTGKRTLSVDVLVTRLDNELVAVG